MKLVADENIPGIDELFAPYFQEVVRVNGRTLSASAVADADVLVVRSVTKVNESLLNGSKVSFVGTCTIGTDHIDIDYLVSEGINWCSAPGCNAEGVADYVMAAIAQLKVPTEDVVAAVIGLGNVGSQVALRLSHIGCHVVAVDPNLDTAEFPLVSLDKALSTADIICCHTPLVLNGDYPSHGLINQSNVQQIKPGALVINAGRGPVVTKQAVAASPQLTWVLDVWDDEPGVEVRDISNTAIATPHIAGYADEGKLRGTWMVFNYWAKSRQKPNVDWNTIVGDTLPAPTLSADWREQILSVYDIMRDDKMFRSAMSKGSQENKVIFDQLRKNYPGRHEMSRYSWD